MRRSVERHDVIVVGVGGVGSAATYHLARRGVDAVGIERFDVPHAKGSSHGRTRLAQRALDLDPATAALADRARDLWRDLEATTGRDLVTETGSLAVGPTGEDPVASARRACERHGLAFEAMTGGDCADRFPVYDFPAECEVVYQPEGAVLAAERGVVAHVAAAIDAGATVRARERVCDWSASESGVRVETDRDVYAAESLVVAAGGWAAEAVDALSGVVEPQRHATAWFGPSGSPDGPGRAAVAGLDPAERPPAFVATVDGEDYYGVPGIDLPGLKVGRGDFRPTAPDDVVEPTQADERPLRAFAESHVPGAAGAPLRLTTGMVTTTPDMQFVLDTLPDTGRVAVAAGLSGRGYKFAPVIGEVLADLALDGATDHDCSAYALSRFE